MSAQSVHDHRTGLLPLLTLLFFLFPAASVAAGDSGEEKPVRFLPDGPLMEAYVAESYSTLNRLDLQWANKAPPGYPWSEGYSNRPLVNIRLGMEIPLLGGSAGEFSWYVGLPVSVEFLTDMFQPDTAPVVNSDYWFGTRLEMQYGLPWRWPRNVGIRSLPMFHESTHLGDELSLFWSQNDSSYYRINVSYEAWDVALCVDEWQGSDDNAFTLRLGMSGRWNSDGYYPIPKDEEFGSDFSQTSFHLSRRRMEYYGQFQAVVSDGFPALGFWVFQGGLEVRSRLLFDYFTDQWEDPAWLLTASIGWRRYFSRGNGRYLGLHLRAQAGQNPHGQYREQDGYFAMGAGFSLGF